MICHLKGEEVIMKVDCKFGFGGVNFLDLSTRPLVGKFPYFSNYHLRKDNFLEKKITNLMLCYIIIIHFKASQWLEKNNDNFKISGYI